MGRVKRSNALSWIFMRYVLVMLGSLVGLVIVAWLLLYLLISVGCIYPANYAEQKINEAYDTILRADKVTAEMIPALCDYVIFSENGEKIGGDLSEQYEQIAWNVAKYGNASGKYFYKVIVRENEYVVLQYRLTPQYHSAFLREHFIGPQNVMSIMSVIGAVAIIIIPSIRFGKRIKKQMQPVLDAIRQIKDQNLEYETSCSGIKEFDDCLSAIDDMRDALRESLEKQWKTEQEKKQQMSALAHDIKTPLKDKDVELLDVRTVGEFSRGHIDGFKNIPVDELRERISEIEKGKPVYLICQSGLRSYIASRILEENGYETYNFSGGFRFYDAVVNDRALIERAYACGMDY